MARSNSAFETLFRDNEELDSLISSARDDKTASAFSLENPSASRRWMNLYVSKLVSPWLLNAPELNGRRNGNICSSQL